jgi:hypothetical protein
MNVLFGGLEAFPVARKCKEMKDFNMQFVTVSVADPGCLSQIRMFIHPGYRLSDPGYNNKEKFGKNFVSLPVFCCSLKNQIFQN